jgi:hypothetical protein
VKTPSAPSATRAARNSSGDASENSTTSPDTHGWGLGIGIVTAPDAISSDEFLATALR